MSVNSIGSMGGVDMAAASMVSKSEEAVSQVDVAMLDNAMEVQEALASTLITQLMDVPTSLDMSI